MFVCLGDELSSVSGDRSEGLGVCFTSSVNRSFWHPALHNASFQTVAISKILWKTEQENQVWQLNSEVISSGVWLTWSELSSRFSCQKGYRTPRYLSVVLLISSEYRTGRVCLLATYQRWVWVSGRTQGGGSTIKQDRNISPAQSDSKWVSGTKQWRWRVFVFSKKMPGEAVKVSSVAVSCCSYIIHQTSGGFLRMTEWSNYPVDSVCDNNRSFGGKSAYKRCNFHFLFVHPSSKHEKNNNSKKRERHWQEYDSGRIKSRFTPFVQATVLVLVQRKWK